MISFPGRHHPLFIILQCVRWYVPYALSYQNIEEMLGERGFNIDNTTLNRWVLHFAPLLEKKARKYNRPVYGSQRMDYEADGWFPKTTYRTPNHRRHRAYEHDKEETAKIYQTSRSES